LGVVVVSFWSDIYRGPGIFTALLSTAAFDYFFIPPYFSFNIGHSKYIFTIGVMLIVTQIIHHLAINIRKQTDSLNKIQAIAESEKIRNTLLLSISHDLRTPLAAIIGSADTLLNFDENLTKTVRSELLQNIYDESERLNQLILNVLQVIRLESNAIIPNKRLQNLEEIILGCEKKFSKILINKKLSIHINKNIPPLVFDNILLEQVLINLIDNANKFSPPESTITIIVEQHEKEVVIKIADNGFGLQANDTTKVFEKFYRGQVPESNGLGLGLAICKGIIDLHGGKIWAENLHPHGAQFCFTLSKEKHNA